MKVSLSDEARRDLADIARFIALDNPTRSRSFVAEIEAKCAALSRSFRRYPIVIRREALEIRKRTVRRYLVFYTFLPSHIEILHVLHGARDWASLFNDPE